MVYRRKNLQLHRLPAPWAVAPDQLEKWLALQAFQPGNTLDDLVEILGGDQRDSMHLAAAA